MLFFYLKQHFSRQKTRQLTTSIPNDRDFHYRELQASLETLLDGFPGVEPLGLPSGRVFFMILPGKMRNNS